MRLLLILITFSLVTQKTQANNDSNTSLPSELTPRTRESATTKPTSTPQEEDEEDDGGFLGLGFTNYMWMGVAAFCICGCCCIAAGGAFAYFKLKSTPTKPELSPVASTEGATESVGSQNEESKSVDAFE